MTLLVSQTVLVLALNAANSLADDATNVSPPTVAGTPAPPTTAPVPVLVPKPAWSPRPPRPRPAPPAAASQPNSSSDGHEPPIFSAEGKWDLAGYNNDEVIYTVFITSHDPRIIRCLVDLKGSYVENGAIHGVTDRQSTTVFPEQRVQAGNWQGMDEKSGATYAVKCHPTS